MRSHTILGNPMARAVPKKVIPSVLAAMVSITFALSAQRAPAQTVTNIYNFTGNNSAAYPGWVKPAQGRDGRLYVTTEGTPGTYGSVLAVGTDGKARRIHVFDNTDGATPLGGVILSTDGAFYGTTTFGGTSNNGVLFRITQNGTYTALHNFAGGSDGLNPYAPPMEATDGNLYGTTLGSSTIGPTVYRYSRLSGYSILHQFDAAQGQFFASSLIQGTDGNLYLSANAGGTNNCGVILKVTLAGTVLSSYSFPCGLGGGSPNGSLLQADDSNFYGTAIDGGSTGAGIVYKMGLDGAVSILYGFLGSPSDGANPQGALVQATDGNLYGTTVSGGHAAQGTLFQISPSGTYRQLFEFRNKAGELPFGSPVQHTNGKIYGTVVQGALGGFGAVYSLDMGLGPLISFVRPSAKVGQAAQILGQGLTGTASVTFGSVPATSFSVVSDTYMTAIVPNGAASGPVTVTTPAGNLVSHVKFRVLQ
jgi:uncharacterized repeat protein (TIGR03803 family)